MSDPAGFFSLRPGRRVATVLLILAFLGGAGLGFGALFGTDEDIEPFVAEPGPLPPGVPAAGLALPALGESLAQAGTTTVRFGPGDAGALVVPEEWTVVAETEEGITLGADGGTRFEATITQVEPTTPATQLVTEVQEAVLASALAAHVRASTVIGPQPFGSLVTRSAVGYSALRMDLQGLSWVGGNLFAFVRDDGLALTIRVEVVPATGWDDRIQDWFPLWASAVSSFAESALPP